MEERVSFEESPKNEKDYERELIEILKQQGYEYIPRINEEELENNLRKQLEKLNAKRIPDFRFTDSEWKWFYKEYFEGLNNIGVENRTDKIQGKQIIKQLKRDDGTTRNIYFIEKKNIEENHLQVINQFIDSNSKKRYDVTILVNGLPLVHIELKKPGIDLDEAFQQVEGYQKVSFNGLFEFIQVFVISNAVNTKYYSNTVNRKEDNSFLFTTNWSNFKNEPITDLFDFARTFLTKERILSVITKYCVFDTKQELKVLRPYQIFAIERIIEKIKLSIQESLTGTNAGGYIWHTTGSGKTLTSFKASQLALKIEGVYKVLFVVDRKDLDSQTFREYKNFMGDSGHTVDDTENTEELKELLNKDSGDQIIVTTIQKLRRLLGNKEKWKLNNSLEEKRIIIIMDECHRSQTKETHESYLSFFKNRCVFGFTGTPILDGENSTKIRFGEELHNYKMIRAIRDNNVLRFDVYYLGNKSNLKALRLGYPDRIQYVVKYILDNFERKTNPNTDIDIRVTGKTKFNSIFATAKIDEAIDYYREFKKQIKESNSNLKVAVIFSAEQDADESGVNKQENKKDNRILKTSQIKALEEAKKDFEQQFGCKLIGEQDYRNEISEKMKNRDIDILIVVNMFLTGFDVPTLNTLWVDKDLKGHNLIQAFSRTNRAYNGTKPVGNIVCFRDLKSELDDALAKYSGEDDQDNPSLQKTSALMEQFEERLKKFTSIENTLLNDFPINKEIKESEREIFIKTWNEWEKLAQTLSSYDEFKENRKLDQDQINRYKSKRNEEIKKRKFIQGKGFSSEKTKVEDVFSGFEIIRYDRIDESYINDVVSAYRQKKDREGVIALANSRITLINKGETELIKQYMNEVDKGQNSDYLEFKKTQQSISEKKIIEEFNSGNPQIIEDFLKNALTTKKLSFEGKGVVMTEVCKKYSLITQSEKRKKSWEEFKKRIWNHFKLFKKD